MVSYNPQYVLKAIPKLLNYLPITIMTVILTLVFGSLLGALITVGELKGGKISYKLARGYRFILRCTPPIVLLFIVYYGIPKLLLALFNISVNQQQQGLFVVISLTLLFAANISQVFKAAYLAIPKGQYEAALSVGLTPYQAITRIIVPQAIRYAIPNFANATLNLCKDSALAYTIGFIDVMGAANLEIGRNLGNYSLETYTAVAIIYWFLALLITLLTKYSEHITDLTHKKGVKVSEP